jgi:hypothetical protein
MGFEDLGDEFAAAAHADLVEDRLEVVLDGLRGYEERARDLARAQAAKHEHGDLAFARGHLVGACD